MKQLAKEAGWPELHPHRGRHKFASALLEGSMDASLAMNLTRYQSVNAFQGYSEWVRYQTAQSRCWEMKGEEMQSPMSLEELPRL